MTGRSFQPGFLTATGGGGFLTKKEVKLTGVLGLVGDALELLELPLEAGVGAGAQVPHVVHELRRLLAQVPRTFGHNLENRRIYFYDPKSIVFLRPKRVILPLTKACSFTTKACTFTTCLLYTSPSPRDRG